VPSGWGASSAATPPRTEYDYRLSDLIQGVIPRQEKSVCQRWPASIACEYFESSGDNDRSVATTQRHSNWTLLSEIVRERQSERPPAGSVVVHLRLGDVGGTLDCWNSELRCVQHRPTGSRPCCKKETLTGALDACCLMARDNASQSRPISLASTTSSAAAHQDGGISCPGLYAYGLVCYRRVFDALPSTASRTLIVVSSTDHSRGGASQAVLAANLAYRASFVRFAQSRGYDVVLREPGSADDDLAFLGGADTFIAGGGGYSLVAAVVSYALGGTVLFPQRICDRSPNSRNQKRARENAASTQCSRRGASVGGMFQR